MTRVDLVDGAGRGGGDGERADRFLTGGLRGLRGLRGELWNAALLPLPPLGRPRRLRWAPHLVVLGITLATTVNNVDQLAQVYRLGYVLGWFLSLAQAAALLLALSRPAAAWWLSLGVNVFVAAAARIPSGHGVFTAAGTVPPDQGGEPWPWSPPSFIAHAAVTLLLALRLPARAAWAAYVLGVGVPFLLQQTISPGPYDTTVPLSALVFGAVTLIGTLLRGRRETRSQLVRQTTLTAEERARRTLLEERSRIARELHDVVAHHMSVISIQAQVAPHLVKDPPDELRENLQGIRENALEALTELRRVLGVLRSEDPEDPDGAPQAPLPTLDRLDGLLDNARMAGLTVHGGFPADGERRPLPPGVDLSAYRIVQEALSNAIRHAPGSTVRIALAHGGAGLRVRVTNTAARERVPPSPGAGHGLLGMRERAAMLGGDLAAGPLPDGGYEVSAFLPTNVSPTNGESQ
ncbi:sensor histidine kinase [Streptomyces sp. NPDC005900]|uniref:sensor histidine kinase n=1 Tax=Streptomyces sp. NPDC005900 TaxID=3154569 RepID=UPI0033CFE08E